MRRDEGRRHQSRWRQVRRAAGGGKSGSEQLGRGAQREKSFQQNGCSRPPTAEIYAIGAGTVSEVAYASRLGTSKANRRTSSRKGEFLSRGRVKRERRRQTENSPQFRIRFDVTSHGDVTLPRVLARMPNGARQTPKLRAKGPSTCRRSLTTSQKIRKAYDVSETPRGGGLA
jgi:hypothetical protein